MLHLRAEVGKPGRRELERKHFPDLFNKLSSYKGRPRGRKFIEHGYCYMDDTLWRPHNVALSIECTDCGPDWESRLRYIPHPSNESQRLHENENWPYPWFSLRTFPEHNRRSEIEWSAYPEGCTWGKICVFDGVHKASSYGLRETHYNDVLGNNKKENFIDKRNGIWLASSGDKSYRTPEYSPDFHRHGSTRPVVNFGMGLKQSVVPLQPLPPIPVEPYVRKEKRRRIQDDVRQVEALETWRPATPLVADIRNK